MKPWPFVEALSKMSAFARVGDTTHCDSFVESCSYLWRCPEFIGKSTIRDMHLHVMAHPGAWEQVGLPEAQFAANQDKLVVAFWSDAAPRGDHGAVIVPGKLEPSGSWSCEVPQSANVGTSNFYGKKLSFAFPADKRPSIYLWREP